MSDPNGSDAIGPVELALLEFSDPTFDGSMASALADLVDRNIVAIVDLVILKKNAEGGVEVVELADADRGIADQFLRLDGEVMWLLSDRDVAAAADHLRPGSAGVLLVWENVWARELRRAVGRSGGRLVVHDRLDSYEVAAAMRDSGAA